VHHLYFNKITTFWKLNFLLSSGKKGGIETIAVGPPGCAILRPNAPLSELFRLQIEGV
jgi:hypothetical protein